MNLDDLDKLQQNHKTSLRELAEKYNRSIRTISRYAKEFGASKSRAEYEQHAKDRRRIAYELHHQDGLKWAEVAEKMGITTANARVLGSRYKATISNADTRG